VRALTCAALAFLALLPARAQSDEVVRPERLDQPSFDLLAVSTQTFFPTASPGGVNEGTCLVLNTSGVPVRARLDVGVVYADGRLERLSRIQDPGVLEPDGGFELNVLFLVPQDAAVGVAQFFCDVRAQSLFLRRQHEQEISISRFEIVAP